MRVYALFVISLKPSTKKIIKKKLFYFRNFLLIRLKNDRARQEQLARDRLERLRNRKNSKNVKEEEEEKSEVVQQEGEEAQENLVKLQEKRHTLEQNVRDNNMQPLVATIDLIF